MHLLRRAFLYNKRQIGKSSILFLILFIMSVTVLVGLSIGNSTNYEIKKLRESLGGSFKVEGKYNKEDLSLWEPSKDGKSMIYTGPSVDNQLIKKVMSIKGIKSYNTVNTWYLYTDDLNLIDGMSSYQNVTLPEYKEVWDEMWEKTSSFIANSRSERSNYFRTGSFQLVEGEHIADGDYGKVLISQVLAAYNHLKLGDVFTASMRVGGRESDFLDLVGNPLELEIVGIFKVKGGLHASSVTPEIDISDNLIFISPDSSKELASYGVDGEMVYDDCTFFLEDPKELKTILNIVKSQNIVDALYYNVEEDDSTYKESAAPLKTINIFINILIALVIGTCAVLLTLILTMWIKGRIKETGILLSIGISKKSIIFQYIVECFMIAILAFSLSFVISKGVSSQIGNSALDMVTPEDSNTMKTITEEEIMNARLEGSLETTDFTSVAAPLKIPESLEISTRIGEFFLVVSVGLGLISFSVYRAVAKEIGRNPKDILMKL